MTRWWERKIQSFFSRAQLFDCSVDNFQHALNSKDIYWWNLEGVRKKIGIHPKFLPYGIRRTKLKNPRKGQQTKMNEVPVLVSKGFKWTVRIDQNERMVIGHRASFLFLPNEYPCDR